MNFKVTLSASVSMLTVAAWLAFSHDERSFDSTRKTEHQAVSSSSHIQSTRSKASAIANSKTETSHISDRNLNFKFATAISALKLPVVEAESDLQLKKHFADDEFAQALYTASLANRHQEIFSRATFEAALAELAIGFRNEPQEVIRAAKQALRSLPSEDFPIETAALVGTIASLESDPTDTKEVCLRALSQFENPATSDAQAAFLAIQTTLVTTASDADEALRDLKSAVENIAEHKLRDVAMQSIASHFHLPLTSVLEKAREFGLSNGSARTTTL